MLSRVGEVAGDCGPGYSNCTRLFMCYGTLLCVYIYIHAHVSSKYACTVYSQFTYAWCHSTCMHDYTTNIIHYVVSPPGFGIALVADEDAPWGPQVLKHIRLLLNKPSPQPSPKQCKPHSHQNNGTTKPLQKQNIKPSHTKTNSNLICYNSPVNLHVNIGAAIYDPTCHNIMSLHNKL